MLLNIIIRVGVEDVSEAAVDASDGLPAVQVDVDLGVAQSSTTSVTGDLNINTEEQVV